MIISNTNHIIIILGMPTKELRKILEPYGYEYAFTDSLISDACSKAKLDLFGQPGDNVKDGTLRRIGLLQTVEGHLQARTCGHCRRGIPS